ncbi:glycosyltransferase family 2 protein [Paracoccus sp. (in: a-proteobacteria)]|uniref:glycosyltransferase family 2 protein n=1 Tax=Paracoccus sp. TaxID=267 RepID=UPI0026E079FD|nr:glycosyltransferase [Paracoccus sp. (in: a-proteobacteria)]MDO5646439.1 glycosyltransferase [Paracoccus sp. (in: a-proteobacteria)]
MTEKYRLLISVINYRTAAMTWACVRSVLNDLAGRDDVLTVVVDNNSGDRSVGDLTAQIAALPAGSSPVRLIESPDNGGFSAGHNLGMGAAPADYYLLLNSDALLLPGFCAAMLSAADAAPPDMGLFSPRITDSAGVPQTSLFRQPSPFSEVIRGAASGPVTRLLGRWNVPLTNDVAASDIGWASFAAIMLRGDMVDQLGGLDEGYFMYFEDIDYCLRAGRAGWRIQPVHNAVVTHDEGGSGSLVADRRMLRRLPAYYYASRTRFMRKAYGVPGPFLANMGWLMGRGFAACRRLFGKPARAVRDGEMRDIWLNFRDPMGDRHAPGK